MEEAKLSYPMVNLATEKACSLADDTEAEKHAMIYRMDISNDDELEREKKNKNTQVTRNASA